MCATFVSIAQTPEQKELDLKVVNAKEFNKRVRVEVVTAGEATSKGYQCDHGVFSDLQLYQRHANPDDARYYPYSRWGEEMDKQESIQVEKLYFNMGARKVCATKLSSQKATQATEVGGSAGDVSAGIVGALSVEFGYKSKSAESLAEEMAETWPWNEPTKRPVAMPGGYFVENARVLGNGVSTTPWELAQRFEDEGRATTTAVVYVSSVRMSASQRKSSSASIKARIKGVTGSLGGKKSDARTEDSDVVSVYVVSFWQEGEYKLRAGPEDRSWSCLKTLPDGAVTVDCVSRVLREVVEARLKNQGATGQIASAVKRASQRLSRRVSETLAAMTLSSSVRVGVVGPVGAGKTSFATTLEIAANRLVPCLDEQVDKMFRSYTIRQEGVQKLKNDGTKRRPYEERTVLGDADGHELVICDTRGIRDLAEESEEFAGYLADDQRWELQKKADEWTGRSTPTPDVVFLVFDGQQLCEEGEEAVGALRTYKDFMATVRQRLAKPHLPFLMIVTKMDLVVDDVAASAAIEDRVGSAFAGDVPEVHFVQNYTRTELVNFSELIENVDAPDSNAREKLKRRQEYDRQVAACVERSSNHLLVARCALNAVIDSDYELTSF